MKEVVKAIQDASSIAILTHENPDGDAIGSSLALYNAIKDKQVDVIIPEYPYIYSYLAGSNNILKTSNKEYDLVITVDCGSRKRIKDDDDLFNKYPNVVIDHHSSNDSYGNINYIDANSSSCCQVVYDIILLLGIEMNKDIGTCIMTGIITDTGGFSHNNVNKYTYEITSNLYDKGVDIPYIFSEVLNKKTFAQIQLYKMVLNRLEFYHNEQIAFSYITKDDFTSVGAVYGEHEGLVDIGRNIDGVCVSILVREDDIYRISLRSVGNVDVSKVAKEFGGGGHYNAAGLAIEGDFATMKDDIIKAVEKML